MIKVIHVKEMNYYKGEILQVIKGIPTWYVYCGRPSKYGNPFFLVNEDQRSCVIKKFTEKILPTLCLDDLIAKAKIGNLLLGCYCAPKKCHCGSIKDTIDSVLASS